jgi:EmrB/QacA subfamily drug resistance transporter
VTSTSTPPRSHARATEAAKHAAPRLHNPTWTLVLVCTAVFMLLLDVTIVSVALGNIQTEFGASLSSLQWVIDAYTLPLAGLLLTAATIGDRLGRKRVFTVGLAVFTVGSLACALSGSAVALDVTRAFQGIGAAMLFGTVMPLIGAAYPDPRRRAGAIGAFGATLAAATAVGPLVGGVLVEGPGWRWIFLINVPIGVIALVATIRLVGESRSTAPRRADWYGTATLSLALLTLVFGLIRGAADGWSTAYVITLFVAAAALLAGFIVIENVVRDPMLDLSLFKRRSFVGVGLAAFAVAATVVASTSYLALYMLNTLGYSPFQGGLRFLPLTIASFVAAPLAARYATRLPMVVPIGGGLALVAIGLALTARLTADSSWTVLVPGFIVAGIGMGVSSAVVSSAALNSVEANRAGMATGTVNTLRQVGVAVGVAALGAIFTHRTSSAATSDLAGSGTPSQIGKLAEAIASGAGTKVTAAVPEPMRAALGHAARAATASGLNSVLFVGALACGVITVITVVLIGSDKNRAAVHGGASTEPGAAPMPEPAL